jgi:Na+/citrate or Na+/malate symporter
LAAHGDYSINAEYRTEIFDIFENFCCIPVFLFIYSTILVVSLNVFCGTSMVPQNCAFMTLLYADTLNISAMVPEEEPDSLKDVGRVWLADRNFKILYCVGLKMHVNLSKPTGYFTY